MKASLSRLAVNLPWPSSATATPSPTLVRVPLSEEDRKKRDRIICEVIATEKSFNLGLKTVCNDIAPALKRAGVSADELGQVLGNVSTLVELSNKLYLDLESAKSHEIGQVFSKIAPFFKLFSEYCDEHANRQQVVAKLLERPQVKLELEKLHEEHPQIQSLSSYLIMPIQRVPRYVLLLEELSKLGGGSSVDECTKALEAVRSVANHVNESIRNRENAEKLLQIQQSLALGADVVVPSKLSNPLHKMLKARRSSLDSPSSAYSTALEEDETESPNSVFGLGRVFIREGDLILLSTTTRACTGDDLSATASNPNEAEKQNTVEQTPRRVFLFSDQLIHGLLHHTSVLSPMRLTPTNVVLVENSSFLLTASASSSSSSSAPVELTFQCKNASETESWVKDLEQVIDKLKHQRNLDTKRVSSLVRPISSPKEAAKQQPRTEPRNCQSCSKRFAMSSSSLMWTTIVRRRNNSNSPITTLHRCSACTRALCSDCCASNTEGVVRCFACEALAVAHKQTLTSLDDQQMRILQEIAKLKQTHSRHYHCLGALLAVILAGVMYLGWSAWNDQGPFGMIGLYLDNGGKLGRITFSSSSSRFDWDFSEEATIATAKTLMLEES